MSCTMSHNCKSHTPMQSFSSRPVPEFAKPVQWNLKECILKFQLWIFNLSSLDLSSHPYIQCQGPEPLNWSLICISSGGEGFQSFFNHMCCAIETSNCVCTFYQKGLKFLALCSVMSWCKCWHHWIVVGPLASSFLSHILCSEIWVSSF